MNATDKKLINLSTDTDKENKSIFSNEQPVKQDIYKSPLVTQIENQKVAENERMKGNEAVKAKEYQEAVKAYTRSIELNPDEAFTYANRAMAFLKLKNFGNVIMDANKAIELKPGYLKAFHRRGKAYAALNKHEDAIKDFQFILEEEPENKDVNKDLMTSRQKLTEQEAKKGATIEEIGDVEEEKPKKKEFVRVAIEESSDEEEEGTGIHSKFPLKSLKEVEEHAKEAKKLMQKGGDEFMRKFEERAKSANKIQLIEEKPKEQSKKEKKPSAAEIELKKVKEEADKKKKEIEEAKAKEEALMAEVEKQKKLVEEAARVKALSDAASKKAADEADKALKELNEAKAQVKELGSKLNEINPADLMKMEKLRPKIDNIVQKVETKKTAAAEKFKLGQYGDAVKAYQQATQILEGAIEDFPLFKQELKQLEATIFNNISACAKKDCNAKMEIEYSTKVIECQEYLTDVSVLLKAYLRRGLAYESNEKYLQAREDMLSVKQLQSDNKQASQCLDRCKKAIKDIYGNKVPEVKSNGLIKMASTGTSSAKKQESPVSQKESPVAKKETPAEEVSGISNDELSKKFTEIKDQGNVEYKAKSFIMAASKFGEGITLF